MNCLPTFVVFCKGTPLGTIQITDLCISLTLSRPVPLVQSGIPSDLPILAHRNITLLVGAVANLQTTVTEGL